MPELPPRSERADESPATQAQAAARAVLGISFDPGDPRGEVTVIPGFAGRSTVFMRPECVLKVYTHRAAERLEREALGIQAAESPGIRTPRVLGSGHLATSAWIVTTRVAGATAIHPPWLGDTTTALVGQLAARLRCLPGAQLRGLPAYQRRMRPIPAESPAQAHSAAAELHTRIERDHDALRRRCVYGFVHGDFSSRNILLDPDDTLPGLIDFEGSGLGCVYEDLATLYVKEVVLGQRNLATLTASYSEELGRLEHTRHQPVSDGWDQRHLLGHAAHYLRWVLQWAPSTDAEFAGDVYALVPTLLQQLDEATT